MNIVKIHQLPVDMIPKLSSLKIIDRMKNYYIDRKITGILQKYATYKFFYYINENTWKFFIS